MQTLRTSDPRREWVVGRDPLRKTHWVLLWAQRRKRTNEWTASVRSLRLASCLELLSINHPRRISIKNRKSYVCKNIVTTFLVLHNPQGWEVLGTPRKTLSDISWRMKRNIDKVYSFCKKKWRLASCLWKSAIMKLTLNTYANASHDARPNFQRVKRLWKWKYSCGDPLGSICV